VGFVDVLFEQALRVVVYLFRSVLHWLRETGSQTWPHSEATVTAQPTVSQGFGCPMVEFSYSYRYNGELYTGLHDEPFLLDGSVSEYIARFSKGQTFVVRVKADHPEISTSREQDQVMQLAEP